MTTPYYEDDAVTLYNCDFREIALVEPVKADAIITDPPYGETSLEWDRWPRGWVRDVSHVSNALWCFGSFRMFMDNLGDFSRETWKFSHEIVWEKHNGSGFATDKFRRVHELATFWYQGAWGDLRHEVPRVPSGVPNKGGNRGRGHGQHTGTIQNRAWEDDGLRLMPSVIKVSSMQQNSVHPTQKPVGIVLPLIEYSVPVGGVVFDPFAGSGTTLLAAKLSGRRAIGCEIDEKYAEAAARRLSQQAFDLEAIA
jgi:site-specific DNA-methyltransferase (adenine-specific)